MYYAPGAYGYYPVLYRPMKPPAPEGVKYLSWGLMLAFASYLVSLYSGAQLWRVGESAYNATSTYVFLSLIGGALLWFPGWLMMIFGIHQFSTIPQRGAGMTRAVRASALLISLHPFLAFIGWAWLVTGSYYIFSSTVSVDGTWSALTSVAISAGAAEAFWLAATLPLLHLPVPPAKRLLGPALLFTIASTLTVLLFQFERYKSRMGSTAPEPLGVAFGQSLVLSSALGMASVAMYLYILLRMSRELKAKSGAGAA